MNSQEEDIGLFFQHANFTNQCFTHLHSCLLNPVIFLFVQYKIEMYFWQNLSTNIQFSHLQQPECFPSLDISSLYFSNPFPQWNPQNFAQQPEFQKFQEPIEPQNEHLQNSKSQNHPQIGDLICNSLNTQEKLGRNLKSTIARDFVKSLKRDTSNILIAKKVVRADIPIKNFIEYLNKKIPDEGKYIRIKILQDLCNDHCCPDFSKLFRVLLKSFLRSQYKISVLEKKKKRMQCLKACRQLELKLFKNRGQDKN